MKNTLNVGILGCGRISSTYFDCFSRGFEGIKLSSVSDLIESKTRNFVKKFDCKYYKDSKSFINDNDTKLHECISLFTRSFPSSSLINLLFVNDLISIT